MVLIKTNKAALPPTDTTESAASEPRVYEATTSPETAGESTSGPT